MTFNRHDDHSTSRDTPGSTPSTINWPNQKAATLKAEYIDDRPLPTLAKAAAAAEEKKKFPPPKKVIEAPKPSNKKGPNLDAMRNTLAALKEEKSNLEDKLKRNKTDTDT